MRKIQQSVLESRQINYLLPKKCPVPCVNSATRVGAFIFWEASQKIRNQNFFNKKYDTFFLKLVSHTYNYI